ncbi:RNA polymerase II elongation factor Ell-like isoform X2 [Planococcus citri]|uniref:RNA polymerase II elongation factor Ell-like isoform X2 n=1 Tax=Planococcus citri TaxID=170843 RepID=UPI0031F9468B
MVVVVYESENWAPFPPKKKWIRHYLEEYPSSEKSSYSTESISSLTPVQSAVASPSPPTITFAPKNVTTQTIASYTITDVPSSSSAAATAASASAATSSSSSANNHYTGVINNGSITPNNTAAANFTLTPIIGGSRSPSSSSSSVATLTNGAAMAAGSATPVAAVSTLPSFSPSPTLTFTFTPPSSAVAVATAQHTPSLLKMPPQSNSRLPSASLPRHHGSPSLVIQRTNTSPPPPPPTASLLPHSRTVQHHSASTAGGAGTAAIATATIMQHHQQQQQLNSQQHPQTVLQQQQQQQQQQHQHHQLQHQHQNSMSSIAIVPHRSYSERTANVNDIKRKMSASGTREVHNKLEKNRRAHLKECFELLKSQVPAIQDEKKPSNLTILRTAIRYVQILRRREQELETELERLAREKIINQQRLTTLKKELTAQWDHIDFNSLLPESVESKPNGNIENGGGTDQRDYEMERDADKIALMSDADDSSQVKSKGDTYYGSSSSTGSCSISPLHISSPNVVSTTSDSLPPQIHIVESASMPLDKLTSTTVVSPLQFLSSSTIRMIADSAEPIALVQHNGGEKVSESATLPKMAVHAGNAYTIISESFQKLATPNVAVTGNTSGGVNTIVRSSKVTNSPVHFTPTGITLPSSVSANHKNVSLPVKSGFPQVTTNGTITTSSFGERTNSVLTTVPVHTNVGNVVNHSFVVAAQPSSGQMLLTTASPHLQTNVMPAPLLKTVSRLQPINGHQLVVKPAMVVVSTAAAAASK